VAQHSFTRTKNISTRARPATTSTRPAYAGMRNPRGLTRSGQDSIRTVYCTCYQSNNCRTATYAVQYCLWRNKQNSFHNVITMDDL